MKKSEMLPAFSAVGMDGTFKAPLSQTYAFLTARLFDEVLGKDATLMVKGDFDYKFQEAYPGEADEIVSVLRKKLFWNKRKEKS